MLAHKVLSVKCLLCVYEMLLCAMTDAHGCIYRNVGPLNPIKLVNSHHLP